MSYLQEIASGETVATAPHLCRFERVSKWYGAVIGLNDVTTMIQPGITGLVGHNGAGKSTMIRLLTGQLRPSLGTVQVRGHDAWSAAAKPHIGYCPDVDAMYEEMSGRNFVRAMARLHGFSSAEVKERTEQTLTDVGMVERADRRVGTYSKGMRQRIKLAQALIHDPDLLVLDEPLNGVDPVGRMELLTLFRQLAARGKAVLVSSHILDDMDTLADQILFICRGRLLASGSLAEIRAMLDEFPTKILITTPDARRLAHQLAGQMQVKSIEFRSATDLCVEVQKSKEFFSSFTKLVVQESLNIERLKILDASTEAIFEYLMKVAVHPW
ncbi:MAG: ABC transporter ATP-binding protein [Planctomycetota bacterium]